ncbi:hypothetical protein ECC02_006954 [Trypanosoma cruzi]|uniref:Present in the outer mitochondrial membrane proteome 22 n=1 Tax=Trypanosoma cruzi TaxID=5693 RepID=A0A7J6Y0X1_TRYCR|nr:hypothetical protein ECC02_006954 [Trypanosoma cruzi]
MLLFWVVGFFFFFFACVFLLVISHRREDKLLPRSKISVRPSMHSSAVPRSSAWPMNGPYGGRGPMPPGGAPGYGMYNQAGPFQRVNGAVPPRNALMKRGPPGAGMQPPSPWSAEGSLYGRRGSNTGSLRNSVNGGSAYNGMSGPTGGSFYKEMGPRTGSMRGNAYEMQNMGLGGPMGSGYGNFPPTQRTSSGMGGSMYGMGGPMGMGGSMYGMGVPMGMGGSMYGMGGPMGMGGSMYGMGVPMGMGGSIYGMGGPMGMGGSMYGMGGPMGMGGSMYGMGGPMGMGGSKYGSVVDAASRRDGFLARNELIRANIAPVKHSNNNEEKNNEKAPSPVPKKYEKAISPVPKKYEKAISPVPKKDEKAPTPALKKDEKAPTPALKKDEKAPTPALKKDEKAPTPALKKDEKVTVTNSGSSNTTNLASKNDKPETAVVNNAASEEKAAPKSLGSNSLRSTENSADKKEGSAEKPATKEDKKEGSAEKPATKEDKKEEESKKETLRPPTGTNIRGVVVIVKAAASASSAAVTMKNATTVTTSGKDEFSFDEVITHTDTSKTMESVMLEDLRCHWLAGHNSSLLIGTTKGEMKDAFNLGTQFITNTLSVLEKEGFKFDVSVTMAAVKGGSEVKDLFKSSGAAYENIQLASSPVFGPALRGMTSKKLTKSSECVKLLEDGLGKHDKEKELLVAFLVLKQMKKSSTGDDTVYLSTLCLVVAGEEVSHLTGIKEKKASEPWTLLRYAVGGASNTVCLLAVSAEGKKTSNVKAVLEVGKTMREVRNGIPRSGNLMHFVEFTKRELTKQRAAAVKDESVKRVVVRLEKMLKDAEEFLANPDSEPKTY